MVVFKKAAGLGPLQAPTEPGTWRRWVHGPAGVETVSIRCPRCLRAIALPLHKVLGTGQITPSIVCPHDGCGFHEHGLLEGWP